MPETPIYLVAKRLAKSDLSWFAGPRRELEREGAGRQRSIGMHVDVLKGIFPPHLLNEDEITLHEYYDTGSAITGPNRRRLLRQHKNWRLGGDVIREGRFDHLKIGDFMLLLFRQHQHGKWLLAWDAVSSQDEDLSRIDLFEYLVECSGDNTMLLLEGTPQEEVLHSWKETAPTLLARVLPEDNSSPTNSSDKKRVERNLMDLYIGTIATLSPLDQREFTSKLTKLAGVFRKLLDGDILQIPRDHATVWKNAAGHRFAFIDGGTASITALGTEPLAVRVGTYTVIPGDSSLNREHFGMNHHLVDNMFGPETSTRVFTADPEENEIGKVRDVARIGLESAAALQGVENHTDLQYLFLHGPLVNPVSPYADCPEFSSYALGQMGLSDSKIRMHAQEVMDSIAEGDESHFIPVYHYMLKKLFKSSVPVAGIIERSSMSRIVATSIIQKRRGTSTRLLDRVIEEMKKYRINDAMLFASVLNEGEYIRPFEIDKNEQRRASPRWDKLIADYPKPWTTYVMLRQTALPVRIEMTQGSSFTQYAPMLSLIYHMALLLPLYAFPVGLDIVDKYAKVPSWMSRQLSRHHAGMVLRQALASGDLDLYNQIRLTLTRNSREWFLRPKHDGL